MAPAFQGSTTSRYSPSSVFPWATSDTKTRGRSGCLAANAGVLNASQITSSPGGVGLTVYLHSRGSRP
jgi:anti-sigma factor RsiW